MMASTGRMIAKLKPHIPMIKFRAGKNPVSIINVQKPVAAANILTENTSTTNSKQKGPVIELSQLPFKFKRAVIDIDEMEHIMRGGADL